MKASPRYGRAALGVAATIAVAIATILTSPANPATANPATAGPATAAPATATAATSATATNSAKTTQVSRVEGAWAGIPVNNWQAKKKRHKAKVANPDNLPQPQVSIVQGSSINLLSRSSKIPLAIKNGYTSQVRLRVVVRPSNLKVLIPAVIEVVVPANTTVTAKVPVTAIADGDVVLHAHLESFSGVRLTVPVNIKMNVILGVEDTVLFGFMAFVAALGALGVIRTVRKRRRQAETEGLDS
jgi:hypothetical protein